MKSGEADNIGKQPGVGTVQIDSAGRRWRKVRRVTDWRNRLAAVIAAVRIGAIVGDTPDIDALVRTLGYELEVES